MHEEIVDIASFTCHLITSADPPKVVLIKPLGPFEWKMLQEECLMIQERVSVPFALCAFEISNMDSFRLPDEPTCSFVANHLVPQIRQQFGHLPIVIGGYSLGGLFALWCSTQCDLFAAVNACSPSLWADWWEPYAEEHQPLVQYAYLSVGDTEEKTRKQPFARMGDCLRAQHQHHLRQLGEARCLLEWNKGGHFDQIELRKAKGFAWCINQLIANNNPNEN